MTSDTQTANPPASRDAERQIAFEPWLDLLESWNLELAGFYTRRFQECSATFFNFMLCRSLEDVADTQQAYARRLIEDYRAMARTLTRVVEGETAADYAAALLRAQQDAGEILAQAKAQAERIVEAAEARARGSAADSAETKAA
jgi:hypothetical protein